MNKTFNQNSLKIYFCRSKQWLMSQRQEKVSVGFLSQWNTWDSICASLLVDISLAVRLLQWQSAVLTQTDWALRKIKQQHKETDSKREKWTLDKWNELEERQNWPLYMKGSQKWREKSVSETEGGDLLSISL